MLDFMRAFHMNNILIEKIDRKIKQLIIFLIDLIILNFLYYFLSSTFLIYSLNSLEIIFLSPIIFFYFFGLYNTTFTEFSSYHFLRILYSIVIFLVLTLFIFFLKNIHIYSLNQLLFFSASFFFLITGNRYILSIFLNLIKTQKKEKIIIYGAGSLGLKCTKVLNSYEIVAFLDDNMDKLDRNISGIKILNWSKVKKIISTKQIDYIFIAIKKITPEKKREIFNKIFEIDNNCVIKNISSFENGMTSKFNENLFKKLKFEDFFNRSLKYDNIKLNNFFKNQSVLVTGGGGSIGLELCKQISNFSPKTLVILDNNEYNLFQARQSISKNFLNQTNIFYKLEDINNFQSLENIFKKYKFNYVFHAAALKHVQLVEENVKAAIQTNIFGSINIIKLFKKFSGKKLVFISTDKAVRPTNFMGATKRITEIYYQVFSKKNLIAKKVSIVRFGNVFGSSGSVINIFKKQIEKGGPLTVTNKKMERYFMSISEAVKLVLYSNTLKKIDSNIFCLDMGERIKIYDLAKKMIFLSGNRYKKNLSSKHGIGIKLIGKFNTEKLKEELFLNNNFNKTKIKNIFTVKEEIKNPKQFLEDINYLNININLSSKSKIMKFFKKYVEGFNRSSKNKYNI